jgi:hypothetical protein
MVRVMSEGRFAGVDWASEEHAACVVDNHGRIIEGDETGTQRAKIFDRKSDAEHYEREVLRLKRTGELMVVDAARTTLAEFGREQWWPLHAMTFAASTRATYASLWDKHILPRIGGLQLRELRPQLLQRFRAELEEENVGPAAIRKMMMLLQARCDGRSNGARCPPTRCAPFASRPLIESGKCGHRHRRPSKPSERGFSRRARTRPTSKASSRPRRPGEHGP